MSLLEEIEMNSNHNKQINKTKNVSTSRVLIGWEEGSGAAAFQRDSGCGGKVVRAPKSNILSLALVVFGLKTFNSICWVCSAFSILPFKTNAKRGDLGHGFKKKRNIAIWDVNCQVQRDKIKTKSINFDNQLTAFACIWSNRGIRGWVVINHICHSYCHQHCARTRYRW